MDLKYLTNKTIDGTKYILAQPTMMFKRKDEIIIIANHIVKDDEAGRPDLIALEHYNDDSMTDIILKFNGISDPFSLMPGEELQIPIDTVPYYKLERPGIFEDNPIKNEFIQGKKFSQKDRNRIEALKKKYNKETLLPPNVIAVGKKNYEFKPDGTVILGAQAQNDAVTESILSGLEKDLIEGRIENLENQISDLNNELSDVQDVEVVDELTENQLTKNLENKAGKGGLPVNKKPGAGKADESGGSAGDGTAPESTGGADGISNDGAPCN